MVVIDQGSLRRLAERWVRRVEGDDSIAEAVETEVVEMNFTAPADVQWRFILTALDLSKSDAALGHLAAGPLEHLLGNHGDEYIARVEEEARRTPRFARLLTGAWQYRMSPTIWARVHPLQETAKRSGNRLVL